MSMENNIKHEIVKRESKSSRNKNKNSEGKQESYFIYNIYMNI